MFVSSFRLRVDDKDKKKKDRKRLEAAQPPLSHSGKKKKKRGLANKGLGGVYGKFPTGTARKTKNPTLLSISFFLSFGLPASAAVIVGGLLFLSFSLFVSSLSSSFSSLFLVFVPSKERPRSFSRPSFLFFSLCLSLFFFCVVFGRVLSSSSSCKRHPSRTKKKKKNGEGRKEERRSRLQLCFSLGRGVSFSVRERRKVTVEEGKTERGKGAEEVLSSK